MKVREKEEFYQHFDDSCSVSCLDDLNICLSGSKMGEHAQIYPIRFLLAFEYLEMVLSPANMLFGNGTNSG